MRKRLVRTVTAVLLAGALAVPASAGAASAAVRDRASARPADVTAVIAVIQKIYSIYQQYFSGGSNGITLQQATTEIINAINSAQTEIIAQIDLVAAADVQGCANATVIDYADMPALTPTALQTFAMNATSCATEADSLLNTVTDEAAIDKLGFAVNIEGPLAMIARAYAGLTTPGLRAVLIDAENADINRVITDANCTWYNDTIETVEVDCTAYNGDVGSAGRLYHGRPPGQDLYNTAMTNAAVHTSRPIAVAALTEL